MFERYTEKARRVIFFAGHEASQFGSPYIETEHLLLGFLREDKALTFRFLRSHASVESIRKQIEGHTTIREKLLTSVDLPLSNECERVLAYAAEEAERLSHKHVGTEHLLLGLLREEKCFAAEILHERGLHLSTSREELARTSQEKAQPQRQRESSLLSEFSRDLTQAAMDAQLDPLVGRESELERVILPLPTAAVVIAVQHPQMLPNDHVPSIGHERKVRAQSAGRFRSFQRPLIEVLQPNVEENAAWIPLVDRGHLRGQLRSQTRPEPGTA
jgi:hypothetical protein